MTFNRKYSLLSLLITLVGAISVSCGRSNPRPIAEDVGITQSRDLELNDVPCDKDSCEEVELYIDGPNGSSEVIGTADADNDWTFVAEASDAPNRDVIMKIYGGPKECKSEWFGQESNEVSCSFKAIGTKKGSTITAIVRDVTYCKIKFPKYADACGDLSKEISGLDDTTKEFTWKVEEASASSSSGAGTASISSEFTQSGPKVGANGGIKGCGMGMLSGITGILQGNFLGAITGCVNGHFDGNKQVDPNSATGAAQNNNQGGSLLDQFGTN